MRCIAHHKVLLRQKAASFTTISILFLLISSSSQVRLKVEAGRANPKSSVGGASRRGESELLEEKRMIMRSQIGSRPPRCERRCSTCGHCEAIQVPTNPQVNHGNTRNYSQSSSSSTTTKVLTIAYARGDGASNYKPMSWKCKCGDLIFNP